MIPEGNVLLLYQQQKACGSSISLRVADSPVCVEKPGRSKANGSAFFAVLNNADKSASGHERYCTQVNRRTRCAPPPHHGLCVW